MKSTLQNFYFKTLDLKIEDANLAAFFPSNSCIGDIDRQTIELRPTDGKKWMKLRKNLPHLSFFLLHLQRNQFPLLPLLSKLQRRKSLFLSLKSILSPSLFPSSFEVLTRISEKIPLRRIFRLSNFFDSLKKKVTKFCVKKTNFMWSPIAIDNVRWRNAKKKKPYRFTKTSTSGQNRPVICFKVLAQTDKLRSNWTGTKLCRSRCDGKMLKVLSMMHEVRKAGLREERESREKGDKMKTKRQGS